MVKRRTAYEVATGLEFRRVLFRSHPERSPEFPFLIESVEPLTQSETEIQVIFPDAAISGEMILELGSGKSVAVPIETQKPGIHSRSEERRGGRGGGSEREPRW